LFVTCGRRRDFNEKTEKMGILAHMRERLAPTHKRDGKN